MSIGYVDIFAFHRHIQPTCRWRGHVKKTGFSYHVADDIFKKPYFLNRSLMALCQTRHSRAGGNPAMTNTPRSGQNLVVAPLGGDCLIYWIPACAGMTAYHNAPLNA